MTAHPLITKVLTDNRHLIASASLTRDEVEIELKPCIRRQDALIFFADLITQINPAKSEINPRNPYRLRLEFDVNNTSPAA